MLLKRTYSRYIISGISSFKGFKDTTDINQCHEKHRYKRCNFWWTFPVSLPCYKVTSDDKFLVLSRLHRGGNITGQGVSRGKQRNGRSFQEMWYSSMGRLKVARRCRKKWQCYAHDKMAHCTRPLSFRRFECNVSNIDDESPQIFFYGVKH